MSETMKSKEVMTITSNEEYVRMRIYDGDLRIDDAAAELLRIERAQKKSLQRKLNLLRDENVRLHIGVST